MRTSPVAHAANPWCALALMLSLPMTGCQRSSSEKVPGPPLTSEDPAEPGQAPLKTGPASLIPSPLPSSNPAEIPHDPVNEILAANLAPGETASRLLGLLPSTPLEEQGFLVRVAGSHCPDPEYWRLLPSLLDRSLSEDCQEGLLQDLLRRPDAVRLRPLYRLAIDPNHPLSAEAREYLFAYFQDVPANDFTGLARAVEKAEKAPP